MGFVFFGIIGLAVVAVLLSVIRLPGKARLAGKTGDLAEKAVRRRQQRAKHDGSPAEPDEHRKAILQRELKKVPVPWGWPGSDLRRGQFADSPQQHAGAHSALGSLRGWIDRLVAEKRTVDDEAYRERKEAALRTMVEDRYGSSAGPAIMAYRKVKPPRLRDPQRAHDQMDNFPSGRADSILGNLSKQPRKTGRKSAAATRRKTVSLDKIKKPWGW